MKTKQKPSVLDTLFRQLGAMKDYEKVMNLYEKYQKKKSNPEIESKLREELLPLINDAYNSMGRIYRVYQATYEETLKAIKTTSLYTDEEQTTFMNKIREYLDKITTIKNEFDPPKKEEKKEEQAQQPIPSVEEPAKV